MRQKVNFYQVDGIPMLAPDAEPEFSFADLDASDSGRDESGVMHRIMVREKVGTWSFSYAHLSDEELAYLRNLFAGNQGLIVEVHQRAVGADDFRFQLLEILRQRGRRVFAFLERDGNVPVERLQGQAFALQAHLA